MNDEIKEILEFKENADYKKLSCDEIKVLRDYITNLQQENERLEKRNKEIYDGFLATQEELTDYAEENERLKQPKIFIDTQDMEERYGEELYKDYLEKQVKDYKSRIEKAVEYLKGNACYTESNIFVDDLCCDECMDLLDILNGRSDE